MPWHTGYIEYFMESAFLSIYARVVNAPEGA